MLAGNNNVTGPAPPPKVNVNVRQLSKDHTEAVQQIKEMKVLVTSFLDTILVRRNDDPNKETPLIKSTIQQVNKIQTKLEKLGQEYKHLRLNQICSLPCGNTGYVILDPMEENTGFHNQLIQCYTWLKNLDEDCTRALSMLTLNIDAHSGIDKPVWTRSEQSLHHIVQKVVAKHPNCIFNTTFLTQDECLEMKVGNTFAVRIFFSGSVISHVCAVSTNEQITLGVWQSSEHAVFQELSDVFNSRVLRLVHADAGCLLDEFVVYVSAYRDLFNTKCVKCEKHLYCGANKGQFLPPLWKEPKSRDFYHLPCR